MQPTKLKAGVMIRSIGVLGVAVLLAAGCSGADSAGGGSGPSGGEGLVGSSLASLPQVSSDDGSGIYMADFEAAVVLLGLDSAPLEDSLADLFQPRPVEDGGLGFQFAVPDIVRNGFLLEMDDLADLVGFEFDEIERIAEVRAGSERVSLITGPEAWGGEAEPHEGDLLTFGQGEDGEVSLENRNSLDQLGRPLRAAQRDGQLAASFSTPVLQGWVDGSGQRFSDDDRLMALAEELDSFEVVSAFLFVDDLGLTPAVVEEFGIDNSQPFISEPFSAVAIGNTVRDGRAIEVISYQFDSEDTAGDALASVEDAWTIATLSASARPVSEVAEFESIEQNGSVVTVVVVVPEGSTGKALEMYLRLDVPLTYLR